MADLAKRPDLSEEAENLAHITQVIVHLQNFMRTHPVQYQPCMRVYATLMYGTIPIIHVNCPHDSDCEVNAGQPCGGITDVADEMETALECLDLELDMEAPSHVYPADYNI